MMYSFERMEQLKVGDIFWECGSGYCVEFQVTNSPVMKEDSNGFDQLWFYAKDMDTDERVEFLVTKGLEHYGPRLYDEPAYIDPRKL